MTSILPDRAVRLLLQSLVCAGCIGAVAATAQAEDEKRAGAAAELAQLIDTKISKHLSVQEITPAPLASDAEFVRRIYLDLIGRTPNSQEARQFLASDSPSKRAELVDDLLSRPEHARHMQHLFDVALMRRLPKKHVDPSQWQAFLRDSFAENKAWDQMIREILSTDGADNARGPARFYLGREGDVDEITRDIARVFLGADLQCAQCHDHPEIGDYAQSHYYGIAAYLTRSFVFTGKDKKAVFAEKAEGEAKFKSVFDSQGEEMIAKPQVFDGDVLEEVRFKKGEEYKVKPAKNVRPIPKFSRREHLADAIASPDNPRFARSIANRIWALLLGRGIVDPVDEDHSGNLPSHPELLDALADQLVAHEFDLRWLIRGIVLSETYQRSSQLADPKASVPPESFAQFPLKPLTPEQFAWSALEATGKTAVMRKSLGDKLTEAELYKKLASYQNRFVQLFGGQPGKPPEDYESTMEQVLFLANDGLIHGLLRPAGDNLSSRLLAMPAEDSHAIVDELFLSVLSRPATDDDHRDFGELLAGVEGEQRQELVQEMVWALLASAEFRFNH